MASTSNITCVPQFKLLNNSRNDGIEVSRDRNVDASSDKDTLKHTFYMKFYTSGFKGELFTQYGVISLIEKLNNFEVTTKRNAMDYHWKRKYDVESVDGEDHLIFKKDNPSEPSIRIVPSEQYFDILTQVHVLSGHGGRDKMKQHLRDELCCYIPRKAIEIYISTCPVCISNKTKKSKPATLKITNQNLKTLVPENPKTVGQIELIDFQNCTNNEYNWLLYYKQVDTNFIVLRPVKSSEPSSIAMELFMIFLTLGPPTTLHSTLERDLIYIILQELTAKWPDCKLTYDANACFDQKSFEIEGLIRKWMEENNNANWSIGCYFVQYHENFMNTESSSNSTQEKVLCYSKRSKNAQCITTESTDVDNQDGDAISELSYPDIKVEIVEENVHDQYTNDSNIRGESKPQTEPDIEFVTKRGLKRQAEYIADTTPKKKHNLEIGHCVSVSVPRAYQGPRNIEVLKGKIVDFQNGVYRVATISGMVKNWFANEDLKYINADYGQVSLKPISLQEAVSKVHQPVPEHLEKLKCNCKPSINQCRSFMCVCYKNGTLCGPKCHKNLTCVNSM